MVKLGYIVYLVCIAIASEKITAFSGKNLRRRGRVLLISEEILMRSKSVISNK